MIEIKYGVIGRVSMQGITEQTLLLQKLVLGAEQPVTLSLCFSATFLQTGQILWTSRVIIAFL